MEAQAREAWRLMMDSQQVQMKVLGMMEDQGKKIAEVAKEGKRKERLDRNEKLRKYWKGKREEAQLEAVRGQISILNLSNEWLDVEMHDHKEMDKLMNVTGAVMGMEESTLSLNREEHVMDELMESVRPEMMDTTRNVCDIKEWWMMQMTGWMKPSSRRLTLMNGWSWKWKY